MTYYVLYFYLHLCPDIAIGQRFVRWHTGFRPAEEPFRSLGRQIDAAMAVRMTIVIVPVRAMEGDPAFGDIQHPGHARQVEAIRGDIAGSHMAGRTFMIGDEVPDRGGVFSAQAFATRRDARREDHLSTFISQ